MAITPPSDIVLDVARAADPARYQAAAEKLVRAADGVGTPAFDDVLDASLNGDPVHGAFDAASALSELRNRTAHAGSKTPSGSGNVYQQFEAFVLRSFVEAMLPNGADDVYGKGTAGGIWKSMLAEQIGNQLAKAGGIGIAAKIAAAHPANPSLASSHRALDPVTTASLDAAATASLLPASSAAAP